MNPIIKIIRLNRIGKLLIALTCSLMVSCGGGVIVAGIGGTGITSGEITGFGSVHVNGVIFNTDNSEFEVDDTTYTSLQDARNGGLVEGMVAKVEGTTNADGVTGTATLVEYDDDVEGPISGITTSGIDQRTFNIFNQEVTIDRVNTTIVGGEDFFTLANNDVVEISGFHVSPTKIQATYVKYIDTISEGSEVEFKGTIDSHDSTAETFEIGGVTIDYSGTPSGDIEVTGGVLKVNLFVEVHGTYQTVNSINATQIEEEDTELGSDIEYISLEGIIADLNLTKLLFTINGQSVDASGAVFLDTNENVFPPTGTEIYNGVRIEVEGTISGGVLFADEVELH